MKHQYQIPNFYMPFIQEQHKFSSPSTPSPAPVSAPAPAPPPPSAPAAATPQQKAIAQAPINAAVGQQQTILAPPSVDVTQGVQKKTLLGQ